MVESDNFGKCENPCNNWCQADVTSRTQDALQFISTQTCCKLLFELTFPLLLGAVSHTSLPQTQ